MEPLSEQLRTSGGRASREHRDAPAVARDATERRLPALSRARNCASRGAGARQKSGLLPKQINPTTLASLPLRHPHRMSPPPTGCVQAEAQETWDEFSFLGKLAAGRLLPPPSSRPPLSGVPRRSSGSACRQIHLRGPGPRSAQRPVGGQGLGSTRRCYSAGECCSRPRCRLRPCVGPAPRWPRPFSAWRALPGWLRTGSPGLSVPRVP